MFSSILSFFRGNKTTESDITIPTSKNVVSRKRANTEIEEDDDNEPILYLVALCHGENIFNRRISANKDYEFSETYEPTYVKIPSKIQFFNKITYTPFGATNISSSVDSLKIFEFLKNEMPGLYSKGYRSDNKLAKKLKKK